MKCRVHSPGQQRTRNSYLAKSRCPNCPRKHLPYVAASDAGGPDLKYPINFLSPYSGLLRRRVQQNLGLNPATNRMSQLKEEKQEVLGRTNRLRSLIWTWATLKKNASSNSSIVACVFVTAVTFLPSRCLATIVEFLPSRCLATIRGLLPSRCLATIGGYTDSNVIS
jgi:hypothetical protein